MPTKTGQGMHGTMTTMAELAIMGQVIENMVTFDHDGEPQIKDLNQYILLVHELTERIING